MRVFVAVILLVLAMGDLSGAHGNEAAVSEPCVDLAGTVGEVKKSIVRSFACESLKIAPCTLRISEVTQCGVEIGFLLVWDQPAEHPVQSWLVEWSKDSLKIIPSE